MGLFGDLVQGALGGFPKKPKVPNAPNVNPQTAQRESIAGNQAALPGLEDLANDVNQFNVDQRRSMLGNDYWKLKGKGDDVLGNWLSGVLSPDVASAVRRNANARAFAGGYGGSGMGDNLQARDLGLTSLDLQKMGQAALPGYLSTTAGIEMPRQFDPVAAFLSPSQQIDAQQWNETNRYGRDWLQNQLNAIPDPYKAAIAKDLGGMADTVGSMIPYFGAFYSMSQGGAGGGSGGGLGDLFGGGMLGGLGGGGGGAGAAGGGAFFGM